MQQPVPAHTGSELQCPHHLHAVFGWVGLDGTCTNVRCAQWQTRSHPHHGFGKQAGNLVCSCAAKICSILLYISTYIPT